MEELDPKNNEIKEENAPTEIKETDSQDKEESQSGVYNKDKQDVEKNAVYVTPQGKVDGVNVKLYDAIEESRVKFLRGYKKGRLPGAIALGAFVVFIIPTIIVFLLMNTMEDKTLFTALLWTFVSLAAVSLVIYTVFSFFSKKKLSVSINDYLSTWTDSFVSDIYVGQKDVENVSYSVEGKVDDWSVIKTHYFATINDIASRSHIVMDFLGKALCDTEVSISVPPYSDFAKQIALEKVVNDSSKPVEEVPEVKEEPENDNKKKRDNKTLNERMPNVGGYGKFISYAVKADDPNSYLIVVRKVKDTYLPTNVHGLTRFDNLASELLDDNFIIWASDEAFTRKVLSSEIVDELKALEPNSVLLDYFFAFNKNEAAFMLNYSSAIMELPMYKGTDASSLEQYPNDVHHVMNIFRSLADTFNSKENQKEE